MPALAALLLACGEDAPRRAGFDLRARVAAGEFSTGRLAPRSDRENGDAPELRFPEPPEIRALAFGDELRQAVVTRAGTWSWHGRIPPGGRLRVGFQALPEAPSRVPPAATIVLRDGRREEVLEVLRPAAGAASWHDVTVDLGRWAGREVSLELGTRGTGSRPDPARQPEIAWAPVRLTPAARLSDARPNVLLVVVDTLRWDRLGCYGYARPTSPSIDREIAGRGVTLTASYAQASATLPSVASLLTSRHPGELTGEDELRFALPPELVTLPERMQELGYVTAGFFGNTLLHAENGFARGFDTFYTRPHARSPELDAAALTTRVRDWVEAHAGERLFVYLHLMDPHDPYSNPDIVDGRSPFYPDYEGKLDVHRPHVDSLSRIEIDDPEAVAHLSALYDSEVRYMDRHLGALLAAIPPRVLADTLVVLTADHGEEFHDHGWWGHGRTTYEEVVHVPLLLRWDGHIPAGSRLDGTVRLLDLMPTIVAAAGGAAAPEWDGTNLLPALTGERPLPPLAAFAQHGYRGPLKAMVVTGGRKLMLFNRAERWDTDNPELGRIFELDQRSVPRRALFDLERDPAERTNLLASSVEEAHRAQVDAMERHIHLQLERQIAGLRVIASGLPAGSRLTGRLELDPPPADWQVYFLDDDDRLELVGSELLFELSAEALDKGFVVTGEPGVIRAVEARLDGRRLAAEDIRLGDAPWLGGPTAAAGLRLASQWPEKAAGGRLYLWYGAGPQVRPGVPADEADTRRRLEALGYLQP